METRIGYINSSNRDNDFFKTIDTQDKAYLLGFLLGDSGLSDRAMDVSVCEKDKSIAEYICKTLNSTLRHKTRLDKSKRIFPSYTTCIGNRVFLNHLKTKFGGNKKKDRRFPRIQRELIPYMVLGFFDADGCITWGKRKDRGRLWQKVCFTADINILSGLQSILSDYDIAMQLRPVANEDCHVLEITNELNVFKIYEFLPLYFSKIDRKRFSFKKWLTETRVKYDFKVGDSVINVDTRTLKKYFKESLYIGKVNGSIVSIDDDVATLDDGRKASTLALSKKGISNYALRLKLDEFGETI